MRRASISQSAIVRNAGLPVNLRTQSVRIIAPIFRKSMPDTSQEQTPTQDAGKPQAKQDEKPVQWKIIIGVVAIAALALWQMAEEFHGFIAKLLHCFSVWGILADGAYATY